MVKSNLIVAAVALALGACAAPAVNPVTDGPSLPMPKSRDVNPDEFLLGFSPAQFVPPPPCTVFVRIAAGDKIGVYPYVVDTSGCLVSGKMQLQWVLENATPNYTFPTSKAVDFPYSALPPSPLNPCVWKSDKQIVCRFNPKGPGLFNVYQYAVNVLKAGAPLHTYDPYVFNN